MCNDKISQVTALLEGYPDMKRKIAVLRYELEHPATVSPDEMIEALSFARGDSEGRSSGHISNKTLYIAMNYQTEAARLGSETMDEITRRLIPLEREMARLEHYISLLNPQQKQLIALCYFECRPLNVLGQELHLSAKTMRKRRDDAVAALAELYAFADDK